MNRVVEIHAHRWKDQFILQKMSKVAVDGQAMQETRASAAIKWNLESWKHRFWFRKGYFINAVITQLGTNV